MSNEHENAPQQELSEILQIRRDKLAELQARGCDPFEQVRYDRRNYSDEIKADFDAWEGYGDIPDAVDADAVTGATVSVSNVSSVIQALFQYHADKYYS